MATPLAQILARPFLRTCALAVGMLAGPNLATAQQADATGSRATVSAPEVQVWFPVDPSAGEQGTEQASPRSSATYRVEQRGCRPRTWRWAEEEEAAIVEIDVVSALVVRLELPEVDKETRDSLAAAAERIASTFRVHSGANLEERAQATLRFPPPTSPLATVQASWEDNHHSAVTETAVVLRETFPANEPAKLRVSAIIARERVMAETLPVELCEDGTWTRDGNRARSLQREAIAPLFFTPEPPKDPTDAAADALAADWAAQLGAWLRTHYVREAAAGALLADGGDPTVIALETDPLRTAAR